MTHIQTSRKLLNWYYERKLELPWRGVQNPYEIFVSEILAQQTQIATVKTYYKRFLERFPTIEALATASLDDVLLVWRGLGYYTRARNLHRAAQLIHEAGAFPKNAAEWLKLPGIGRYTANAISSFAYGERVPVLDGNVMRVLTRVYNIDEVVTRSATQRRLWDIADQLIPAEDPAAWNSAMMDLGRDICTPRKPKCAECPIAEHCLAYARGTQEQRPVKAPKKVTPHYDVSAGIIWNNQNQVLIAQRKPTGLLAGLWEFPGGKREAGETMQECLIRELREELVIEVEVHDLFTKVKHAFSHFKITLHAFHCTHIGGEPQAIGCAAWRWVTLDELDGFAFGKADTQVIKQLREKRLL
jgi:A/G-specific adenine glycosylase